MPGDTYARANLGKFTKNKGSDFILGSHFKVDYGSKAIEGVTEITGLGDKSEKVAFADGEHAVGSGLVRPGLKRMQPVKIKRYCSGDPTLANIWKDVVDAKTGQVARDTLALQMLNDTTKEVAWEITLFEAWMSEYSGPTFDAHSSALTTESATFVFEYFKQKKG